jgi:hypothetical protein
MARKPVEIPIASDTRQFMRGVQQGVIGPLDDVQDALEKVGREGDRAGQQLEDGMRDAQRGMERLDDATKQMQDTVERGSRTSFRKFADNSEDSTRKASENVDEFKDEAKQNFSEVASSFTGDMDSAIDLVQGTLGGLASSIPGIGLVLGGLGAVAGTFYQQWKDNAEKTKQIMSDMYDDLLQSGSTYLSENYLQSQAFDILKGQSDILDPSTLQEIADLTQLTSSQVAFAFAGDQDLMAKAKQRLIDHQKIFLDQLSDETDLNDSAAKAGYQADQDRIDLIDKRNTAISSSIDLTSQFNSVFNTQVRESAKGAQKQHEAFGKVVDDLGTIRDAATNIPDATFKVKPVLDSRSFDNGLKQLTDKQRTVKVNVEFRTRSGQVVK